MFSTHLGPYTISYQNGEEYHRIKSEVWSQGAYYFETNNREPRIIDAGAHIGLATLYFKKIYPQAHITAIEPHPLNFSLLEENISQNHLQNVTLVQSALAAQVGRQTFFTDSSDEQWHSTASFTYGAWTGSQKSQEITVPTLPLSNFLTDPVDFVKLDIEGAEQEVLTAAASHLHQIKKMIIEFHPVAHQFLPKLIEFLKAHRFEVIVWKESKSIDPKKSKGLVLIECTQR